MKIFSLILILSQCVFLTACIYSQHTNERHKGGSVSAENIAMVESGKTTKQWILTNFGIPERSLTDKDGLEIFEYVSGQSKKTSKNLIFLFNIESEKEVDNYITRVVMRDNLVISVNSQKAMGTIE